MRDKNLETSEWKHDSGWLAAFGRQLSAVCTVTATIGAASDVVAPNSSHVDGRPRDAIKSNRTPVIREGLGRTDCMAVVRCLIRLSQRRAGRKLVG